MNKRTKHFFAILLMIVAGIVFLMTGYQTGDVPYMIMGVGVIAAAIFVGIAGRGDLDDK